MMAILFLKNIPNFLMKLLPAVEKKYVRNLKGAEIKEEFEKNSFDFCADKPSHNHKANNTNWNKLIVNLESGKLIAKSINVT